jgi:LysR family cyn operon transcriptional activator
MTDRQLEYVLEIARQGNITAAAQKLYISQPSLSNVLAHVEENAGARFFDRSLSPMPLTFEGELYVQAAKKTLAIWDEFRHQLGALQDSKTGRLKIGCVRLRSEFLIPAVIPVLFMRFPGVQYTLIEDNPTVLEEQLLQGDLDIIFNVGKPKNPLITYVPLTRDEMLLLAPRGLNLSGRGGAKKSPYPRVDMRKTDKLPFVLLKGSHQLRVIIDRIFADMECIPTIILETDYWETCVNMVNAGIALTLLPNVRPHNIDESRIRVYSFKGNYCQQTFLCYRKNGHCSRVMTELINIALAKLSDGA